MTGLFWGELMGTLFLILLGDGVVAGVLLNKSKAQNAGWIVITTGWCFAVMVGVFVARRDICGEPGPKGYPLVYAADGMTLDRLSTNPQFTRAWLNATIPATDMDGNQVDITLQLDWVPTSPLERSRVSGNAWLPEGVRFGAHVHTFSHGLRADALASGQVTLAGQVLTLAPTSDAQMEQVRYFCQVIQHPRGGAEVAC